jgi:hypothetical protein
MWYWCLSSDYTKNTNDQENPVYDDATLFEFLF